jgi:hypothetical protein
LVLIVRFSDLHDNIITNDILYDIINRAKSDVNKQISNTIRYFTDKRRKPKTASDLMALLRFPKDKAIKLAISEEVYERALQLIFKYAMNISYDSVGDRKPIQIDPSYCDSFY